MAITIQIPTAIEKQLREEEPNLDIHVRDQFVISRYQAGKLSTADLCEILGLETRQDAHAWLAKNNTSINYAIHDLEQDRKNLNELFGNK